MKKETGPHFGPRKIGQAQFNLKTAQATKEQHFGPKKFGPKKVAEMDAAVAEAKQKVVDEKKKPKPVDTSETTGSTSIKQIDKALQDNPAVYEEMYALELQRAEGPRKGALRLFMAAEVAREGGPREDRIAELDAALKPKK